MPREIKKKNLTHSQKQKGTLNENKTYRKNKILNETATKSLQKDLRNIGA